MNNPILRNNKQNIYVITMKIYFKSIFCLSLLSLISCSTKSNIVIEDFEADSYKNWTVEGEAFGTSPAQGNLPNQQPVTGFEGKGLANSYHGGDDSKGTLTSPEFIIERDYVNYLLGGGKHTNTYIELEVEGKSIYQSRSIAETESLLWMTWDVKDYKGKKARIKIVDNQQGGWGHILVDQIEMSDTKKSKIMVDNRISFSIDKKYLLIPIDDNAPETQVYLEKDGTKIGSPMGIRIAQEKIEYWIPIDVERYKGQELSLLLDHVKSDDIGYSQIKQSDTYDFDYNEKYRPLYHFSPQYGWTNDPNGMIYHDGEYHLFFQHNPYGSTWGNMSWGHAVSKDLKKWEYLPVAISPDSLGTIFSGSAVIDKDNTSGFGENAMVVIYTSAGQAQTQSIAYSLDNGRTFTKYDHNPVLSDPDYVDFRDPKVFWHQGTNQWIMSLATTQTISFYGSKNLKEWNKLSEFGEGIGSHSGVWECPDLFPLTYNGQNKWVLFVSLSGAIQYFIGDFDGKIFKADKLPYPIWLDYGRDNYAGVTWTDAPDNRRVFIGWMTNWDYANHVPMLNFRNAMTIPRELKLINNGKHLVIANSPVKEIAELRRTTEKITDFKFDKEYAINRLLKDNQGAYEIEMTVKPTANFNFKLMNKKGENLKFTFDLTKGSVIADRSNSGVSDFNNNAPSADITAPLVKRDSYKIRLLIDKSSSELFINDGEVVQTNTIFPSDPYNALVFESEGNVSVENINIYELK